MPSGRLVLIDTSVWIDYLSRKDPPLGEIVDQLLENDRVACAAIVLSELIQGAKSEKEIRQLRIFLHPLHWIQGTDAHWERAGELSFRLKQSGKTANLTDCYIASLAQSAEAAVLTRDKDFLRIAEARGCNLFMPT